MFGSKARAHLDTAADKVGVKVVRVEVDTGYFDHVAAEVPEPGSARRGAVLDLVPA